jgi:membrane protein insertase Oxa1/YidC/SpoIIIJ
MLYMDLQIDPLAAVIPLLVQLPIFWGLYRGVRRLGIVEYDHLKEPFLWIPSLYGRGPC